MKFTKMIAGAIAAVTVMAFAAGSAKADTVTFADFSQQSSAGAFAKPFTFTNTGATSTFTVNTPVFLVYRVPNGTGFVDTNIAGTLVLNAVVDAPATQVGTAIDQTFGTTTLTFTATTPVMGLTNLLTVTATSSDLSGRTTNGAPTLNLDNVTFTSDFLNFAATTERNGSLSFSGFNNLSRTGGYLTTNKGNGNGTFASDPAPTNTVPEPATTAAMGLGMLGIFGMMFRARKRSMLSVTA